MPQLSEQSELASAAAPQSDFLPIEGTDHIEFYVGNAKQAAYFYRSAVGFRLIAYRGPETGTRDAVSYVLEQGKIRFVFTTPLHSAGPLSDHILKHGDGVEVDCAHGSGRAGSLGTYDGAWCDQHGSTLLVER